MTFWFSSTSWWFIVTKSYLEEIFPEGIGELCNVFPGGQLSTLTPLPPIQGRNRKIKPHLTVYSTQITLTPGPARILQCQRQGDEKPGTKKRKEICKMWASEGRKQLTRREFPASSDPVYEIWAPAPPDTWSQDTKRMENEKTSSHFLTSPVCSHLLPVGPQTGQVWTTFPSHASLFSSSCFLDFRGTAHWKGPQRSSSSSFCLWATQCLTVKDCVLCFGIFYNPCWSSVSRLNHSFSKVFST